MKNRTLLILPALLFLESCISSRHNIRTPCNDNIRNTTVLVPEVRGLSSRHSERLFEIIEKELSPNGTKPMYFPREEWKLASKGIVSSDFAFMTKLAEHEVPFLLIVDIVENHSGPALEYSNADQVHSRFGPRVHGYVPPESNASNKSVSILISIVSTERKKPVYRSVTKTNVNPITFRERNDGEIQVNAGSASLALQKAVKKGIRNLTKECLAIE